MLTPRSMLLACRTSTPQLSAWARWLQHSSPWGRQVTKAWTPGLYPPGCSGCCSSCSMSHASGCLTHSPCMCAAFADVSFDSDKFGAPPQNKDAVNLPSTFFKTGPHWRAVLLCRTYMPFAYFCLAQELTKAQLRGENFGFLQRLGCMHAGDQLQEKLGFNTDADNLKDQTRGSVPGAHLQCSCRG